MYTFSHKKWALNQDFDDGGVCAILRLILINQFW